MVADRNALRLLFCFALLWGTHPAFSKPREAIDCTLLGLRLQMDEAFFLSVYEAVPGEPELKPGRSVYELKNIPDKDILSVRVEFADRRLAEMGFEFSSAFIRRTPWFKWVTQYNKRYGQCVFTQEGSPPTITDIAAWQDGKTRFELRHIWQTDSSKNYRLNSRYLASYAELSSAGP